MTPRSVLRYETWTLQPDREPDEDPAQSGIHSHRGGCRCGRSRSCGEPGGSR
ncbi:DUF7848 domain-containing protein [Streptomyces goshikiensis]|uniref:DUF7848 domain-containing protein n=1 Tax=Streptomyces goshikiensis TaxID=1942 RepID=UPI0036CE17CB